MRTRRARSAARAQSGVDEEQLVSALLAQSDEAIREYLERYRPLFQHCAARFESDSKAREDLQHDLASFALDRLRRGAFNAERGRFGTWLYRVAWCRCVDLKRKDEAQRSVELAPAGDDLPDSADQSPSPDERAQTREIQILVREALRDLPAHERRLIELRNLEGLTLPDIASRLGITLEQAKYRHSRAEALLRRAVLSRASRRELVE